MKTKDIMTKFVPYMYRNNVSSKNHYETTNEINEFHCHMNFVENIISSLFINKKHCPNPSSILVMYKDGHLSCQALCFVKNINNGVPCNTLLLINIS